MREGETSVPVAPEITVSYEADAYSTEEIGNFESRLAPLSDLRLDPVRLPHSAGTCEIWATMAFPVPALVRGALATTVYDGMACVCAEIGDWWRDCARSRVVEPEVLAVHIEFADVRIAFDSEGAQGSYLGRAEIRAIPSLLRDMARRLAPLASADAPPTIRAGIRSDRTPQGAVQCFLGRYWQIGPSDEDPDLVYDSWREWFYRRTGASA